MKKLLVALFAIASCTFLFFLVTWHLNDGFSLSKIESHLQPSSAWEVKNPPQKEIAQLLNQNFYYLGKGSQCFVFESEDKQIVMKFFRHSRYRVATITNLITSPAFLCKIQDQKSEAKQKKLNALFQSCTLAYNELKNESGLLYLHLNKTSHLNTTVILYDKLKRPHPINIDDYEFVIQHHAEHLFFRLQYLLSKHKTQEVKEALSSLITILSTRLQKGITDHDAVIHKNSGFIGNQALFLDIGEFTHTPCPNIPQELLQTTSHLRQWLHIKDPSLALYLERIIEAQKSPFQRL